METKNRPSVLFRPVFILALVILLLNDHFLKYTFPGFVTGKLSDITGLFVFHVFLLQFFPEKRKQLTIFVVLFFVWWKSPFSQMGIDFLNSFHLFSVHRVVDYSDLLVLPVLFFSWIFFHTDRSYKINFYPTIRVFVFSVCIYSFFATSISKNIFIHKKRNVYHTPEKIIDGLIRNEYEFEIDTTTTAANYTFYTIKLIDTRFTVQNILGMVDSIYSKNLTLVLYPQNKRKTLIEANLVYPRMEPFVGSKDSLKKELKIWLKGFK